MDFQIDIWLRGDNHATTTVVSGLERAPGEWTDDDVRFVLEQMLRTMDRQKNPGGDADRIVQLRGLSWIVNPFDNGVVIAIEITLGAAIAGPFSIEAGSLETMIRRVLASPAGAAGETVH